MASTKKQKEDTSTYNFQRRKRKQNISVPLEETTIAKLKDASDKYNMPRAEVARFAVEYAMKSPAFHDLLKQLK